MTDGAETELCINLCPTCAVPLRVRAAEIDTSVIRGDEHFCPNCGAHYVWEVRSEVIAPVLKEKKNDD